MSQLSKDEIPGVAAALYDGGWRAGDVFELITEYGLTEDTAIEISLLLTMYEMEGRNKQKLEIF